jgi:hypothetical protein
LTGLAFVLQGLSLRKTLRDAAAEEKGREMKGKEETGRERKRMEEKGRERTRKEKKGGRGGGEKRKKEKGREKLVVRQVVMRASVTTRSYVYQT